MITALLTALTLTTAPAPAVAATPEELVLVRVEATRLIARNLGHEDRVLLFASADRTKLVSRRLRAGQSLRLDYPRRALDGAWLEVLDTVGEQWTTTGALSLSPGTGDQAWTLFLSPPAAQSQAHGPHGSERVDVAAAQSLLPIKAQPFFQVRALEHSEPTHVPGPKPSPPTPGDTPPELEKDPLPPL